MKTFEQNILLTKEECDIILKEHTVFERSVSSDTTDIKDITHKNYIDNWRTSYGSNIELSDTVKNLLLSKLKHYNIIGLGDGFSRVVRYESGQQFKKHRDSEDGYNHRYKTLVIQLSEESNYSGGELRVWQNDGSIITAEKNLGNVILFNSDLLHEVTPILNGVRFIWISWLTIEDFAKQKGIL